MSWNKNQKKEEKRKKFKSKNKREKLVSTLEMMMMLMMNKEETQQRQLSIVKAWSLLHALSLTWCFSFIIYSRHFSGNDQQTSPDVTSFSKSFFFTNKWADEWEITSDLCQHDVCKRWMNGKLNFNEIIINIMNCMLSEYM